MAVVFLVGFMGCGKTSVGRLLANELGVRFVDLDRWIEERAGMTVAEVFAERGEPAFRRMERECLSEATARPDGVVATGGGAFCSAENRRLIRESGGCTVFLDAPWPVIARRLVGTGGRPKFQDPDSARQLFHERRPHYLSASLIVPIDEEESAEVVAARVRRLISESACATSC